MSARNEHNDLLAKEWGELAKTPSLSSISVTRCDGFQDTIKRVAKHDKTRQELHKVIDRLEMC